MIIAYDVSHIQTRRGGIGKYSLSLLKGMLESNTDLRFILHGWSNSIDMKCLAELDPQQCLLNARRLPGFVKRAYWERMPIVPVSFFTGQFDLFHSADPFFPPVRKEKVLVTVHDLLSGTHPQYFERAIVRRDSRVAERIGRADAVVVPSQFTMEQLAGLRIVAEDRIHIVPPPLSLEFTEQKGASDEVALSRNGLNRPYILFVGTLEPRKNIPSLVKAFETLCGGGMTGVDLVIAGKLGWMSRDLPRQIGGSPYANRIRWLEYVPENDLAALYRGALCFVFPSFVEGYGMPVAEAMACGVPVITSDSSGMREVAGGACLLVDPSSMRELSGAIALLINDRATRIGMRESGLIRAKAIRDVMGPRAIIKIYETLVQR